MTASAQLLLVPEEGVAADARATSIPLPQAANDTASDALVKADAVPSLFTPLEWSVIGIGRRDRTGWFAPNGLADRIQRLLFGIQAPRPFADPRLEALRKLALATARPGRNPAAAAAAATRAGLTPAQIRHLQSNR